MWVIKTAHMGPWLAAGQQWFQYAWLVTRQDLGPLAYDVARGPTHPDG